MISSVSSLYFGALSNLTDQARVLEKPYFQYQNIPVRGKDVLQLVSKVILRDGQRQAVSTALTIRCVTFLAPLEYLMDNSKEMVGKAKDQFLLALKELGDMGLLYNFKTVKDKPGNTSITEEGEDWITLLRTRKLVEKSDVTTPVDKKRFERLRVLTQNFTDKLTGWDIFCSIQKTVAGNIVFSTVKDADIVQGISDDAVRRAILEKALPALKNVGLIENNKGAWSITVTGKEVHAKGNPVDHATVDDLEQLFSLDIDAMEDALAKQESVIRKLEEDAARATESLAALKAKRQQLLDDSDNLAVRAESETNEKTQEDLVNRSVKAEEKARTLAPDIEVEERRVQMYNAQATTQRATFDRWNVHEVQPNLDRLRTARANVRLAHYQKELRALVDKAGGFSGTGEVQTSRTAIIDSVTAEQATLAESAESTEYAAKVRQMIAERAAAMSRSDAPPSQGPSENPDKKGS